VQAFVFGRWNIRVSVIAPVSKSSLLSEEIEQS
jgi:hypothetical protein